MRISARKGVKFYQNWAISLPVEPVRTPEELAVPLSVVKGETLTLAVQPGDRVEKYQPLAQSENDGCPVCAPCAGRFLEIVERKVPGLGKTPCARIQIQEEDPADVASAIQPPRRTGRYTPSGGAQILEAENAGKKELSLRRLIGIAKRAAIVDETDGRRLYKKLEDLKEGEKPAAVYVDGVDDQPFMAAGLSILASFGPEIAEALGLLADALSAKGGILVRLSKESSGLLDEEFFDFPVVYIHGKYPSDPAVDAFLETVGGVRFGVGACLALARAVRDGVPQTSSIVTVAGDGVQTPLNLEVPYGVSVGDLLEQCGAFGVIQQVVAGGLMTGRIVGPQSPLHPGVTALTAQAETPEPPRSACTGCGRCAAVCPAGLAPFHILQVAKKSTLLQLEALGAGHCMECGCCSYICPASLPLTAGVRWASRSLEAAAKRRPPIQREPIEPFKPKEDKSVQQSAEKPKNTAGKDRKGVGSHGEAQ